MKYEICLCQISNGKSESLILAPKMEHQLELGAEAVTLEEGLYQWASLKFRPGTSLARGIIIIMMIILCVCTSSLFLKWITISCNFILSILIL